MKQIKFLLIMLIILSGCQARKKSTKTNIDTATKTEFNQSIENQTSGTIKNDKTASSSQNTQNDKKTDLNTTVKVTEYYPPEPGSDKDKGAVKSETETKTEQHDSDNSKQENTQNETDKGKSESKQDLKSNTNGSENSKASIVTEEKTKTTPNRLPYIFGIIVVLAILLIVFRKSPLLAPIWALFSKIFKPKSNG